MKSAFLTFFILGFSVFYIYNPLLASALMLSLGLTRIGEPKK